MLLLSLDLQTEEKLKIECHQFSTFHTLLWIAREREIGMDLWSICNGYGAKPNKKKKKKNIMNELQKQASWVGFNLYANVGEFLKTC